MEDNKGVTKITKTGIVINLCLSAFLVALLTVFNTEAVMIFTDDKDVISTAKKAFRPFLLTHGAKSYNYLLYVFHQKNNKGGCGGIIKGCGFKGGGNIHLRRSSPLSPGMDKPPYKRGIDAFNSGVAYWADP